MVLAVLPRRLNLEAWQWATVAVIAAVGIALAVLLSIETSNISPKPDLAAAPTQTESARSEVDSNGSNPPKAPAINDDSSDSPAASTPKKTNKTKKNVPAWTTTLENTLSPLAVAINLTYIIGDVFLLIVASTLLLAFWGGKFVQSWRMIAAATISLYIADMWTKYAAAVEVQYESGGLLEVFYVFSGVLFAIGAALEYDISIRSRRGGRKRA
jgi:hypothetical protein